MAEYLPKVSLDNPSLQQYITKQEIWVKEPTHTYYSDLFESDAGLFVLRTWTGSTAASIAVGVLICSTLTIMDFFSALIFSGLRGILASAVKPTVE